MEKELQEQLFQDALKHWREFNDKESWDKLFLRVYEACKAMSKKLLKVSLSEDVFHDRLMTSVETVVRYIRDGQNPRKLITFCYWPVYAAFFGPKAIKEDNTLSYEYSVENGHDIAVDILGCRLYILQQPYEEVKGIYRKELVNTND